MLILCVRIQYSMVQLLRQKQYLGVQLEHRKYQTPQFHIQS